MVSPCSLVTAARFTFASPAVAAQPEDFAPAGGVGVGSFACAAGDDEAGAFSPGLVGDSGDFAGAVFPSARFEGVRSDGTRSDGTRAEGTRAEGTRFEGTRSRGTRRAGAREGRAFESTSVIFARTAASRALGVTTAPVTSIDTSPARADRWISRSVMTLRWVIASGRGGDGEHIEASAHRRATEQLRSE